MDRATTRVRVLLAVLVAVATAVAVGDEVTAVWFSNIARVHADQCLLQECPAPEDDPLCRLAQVSLRRALDRRYAPDLAASYAQTLAAAGDAQRAWLWWNISGADGGLLVTTGDQLVGAGYRVPGLRSWVAARLVASSPLDAEDRIKRLYSDPGRVTWAGCERQWIESTFQGVVADHGGNWLSNPTFEHCATGWQCVQHGTRHLSYCGHDDSIGHTARGSATIGVSQDGSGAAWYTRLRLPAGRSFSFSTWLKMLLHEGASVRVLVWETHEDGRPVGHSLSTHTESLDWTWFEHTIPAASHDRQVFFFPAVLDGPGTVWVDDVRLEVNDAL